MAFANTAAIIISLFGPKVLFNGFRLFLAPFHKADWAAESIPYKIFITFLISVTSFHWCLTVAMFLSHAVILIEMMRRFNARFNNWVEKSILVSGDSSNDVEKSILTNNETNIFIDLNEKTCVGESQLEKYRILHLKLAYLVHLLDDCYKEMLGVMIVFYINAVLLLLYIMSDWSGNCVTGIFAALYPFWTIASASFLIIVIIFAAIINSQVKIFKTPRLF